ncbi:hypothetical protein CYY_000447 [Polysphondylium violaceum]|uniref:Uncharacterized protein n=1 Tax=Polysphondylium violaceum TaxID=133409 RepID=A0A8J4V8Y4_9MYCE|nr:hypothetical protein CYY_000447 [Polysphondylium violaceum]
MNFNQFFNRLRYTASQFARRNYSSHSISNSQIAKEHPQPKPKKSMALRVLGLVVVSKVAYDTTNTVMAYYKGNKALDTVLQETWNEAIYPVYQFAIQDKSIVAELGSPVSLGKPESQSTSPITEVSRDFQVGFYVPKPLKDVDTWYLNSIPQLSNNTATKGTIHNDKQKKEHQDKVIASMKTKLLGQQFNADLLIENAECLPFLVPYQNKTLFAFPYGETTSNLSIPIKGSKKSASIVVTLYANDDKWQIRSAAVVFENNKKVEIIQPNVQDSYLNKK